MSSRKYVGDNMSARNRRKYVGPNFFFFFSGALPPNPRAGGSCTPPLTPLRARRRRSNTTTRAKNITHTQQRTTSNAQCTREQFLAKISLGENAHRLDNSPLRYLISHLEIILMGMKNCLFDHKLFFPKHRVIQWK
jgi:hypothetical protein